jgi:hypothetical protein
MATEKKKKEEFFDKLNSVISELKVTGADCIYGDEG